MTGLFLGCGQSAKVEGILADSFSGDEFCLMTLGLVKVIVTSLKAL